MMFKNFELHARPYIDHASCKCGNYAIQVSNGIMGTVLFCPHCESVYELKMVKVPTNKISVKFIEQARREVNKKSSS